MSRRTLGIIAAVVLVLGGGALVWALADSDDSDDQTAAISEDDAAQIGQPPDKATRQKLEEETDTPRVPAIDAECGRMSFSPVPAFLPHNVGELKRYSRSIVVGQVESVSAGADIVIPVSGEPTGEVRIPTQRVSLKVSASDKGNASKGETVTVFKTGNNCTPVDEDPPYKKGEEYLLFLRPGPGNSQAPVSPVGRFKVDEDDTLQAVSHDKVASEFHGKKLGEVRQQVKSAG